MIELKTLSAKNAMIPCGPASKQGRIVATTSQAPVKYTGFAGNVRGAVFDLTAASTGANEALIRQGLVKGKDTRHSLSIKTPCDVLSARRRAFKNAVLWTERKSTAQIVGTTA